MSAKKSIGAFVILGLVAVMVYGLIGSGAWFTDTVTSDENVIQAGTLSINDAALSQATIAVLNMAPGDVTDDVVLYITNNGTIDLAWFGDLVIEGDSTLKGAIYIDYAKMEFLGGSWAEPEDNFITDGVGSGPYPGWYNTLAASSPFGVVTLDVFDGSNGMGVAPYEFMGALKPGFAYKLTLRFGFAKEAGNEYQNLGPLTITFKTDATQINAEAIDALHSGWAASSLVDWFNIQIANQD